MVAKDEGKPKVERLLGEILEKLIRAKFTRDRREILESVNVDLEVLRFQLSDRRETIFDFILASAYCFVPIFAVLGDKVAQQPQSGRRYVSPGRSDEVAKPWVDRQSRKSAEPNHVISERLTPRPKRAVRPTWA